ncbi:MAG: L-seryl-tRNA(Sec) selenium transferase [Planctomycetota bacterium]
MDRIEGHDVADRMRSLPAVDALARDPRLADLPPRAVVREARALIAGWRERLQHGHPVETDAVVPQLRERILACLAVRHRRVINGTGIVLHTGLGRAPLCDAARRAVQSAAGYAVVEVDPSTAVRNQREEAVAALLCGITGAGGALVVNNNAAAVNLTLRALARDREVVVSRGEQVEIGGGFRMPDVMAEAGCRMVEVGTTNRTHRADYQRALGGDTAMLLKVHPSNFRVLGFHTAVSARELVELAHPRGVPVFEDLGSGLLCESPPAALRDEPTVQDSLAAGVDLCAFSGDKLLGGPQAGILLGSRDLVARVRAHPLYRAFRCDKLTLAALEATLAVYRDGDPLAEIPVLRAIHRSVDALRGVAECLAAGIPGSTVQASESFAGSGANPARAMPSFAVTLADRDDLARRLRRCGEVPVFARVEGGRIWLDARTLADEDLGEVAGIVRRALAN